MISKEDKSKILQVFGGRYSKRIKKLLDKKNKLNRDGKQHTANMIRHVMNGIQHKEIEEAIFEVYKEEKLIIEQRADLLHNQF